MLPHCFGAKEFTAKSVPFDSENKEQLLRETKDMKSALPLAVELTKQNASMTTPYDIFSLAA